PRPDRPLSDPDSDRVTHAFKLKEGALTEETHTDQNVTTSIVQYAFGTADRYLTFVTRDAHDSFHIARMSYYDTPDGKGWDRSALDKPHPDQPSPTEFLGEPISTRSGLAKCLYCHTTNARGGSDDVGPETADRAIGCERCHGPGGNHLL